MRIFNTREKKQKLNGKPAIVLLHGFASKGRLFSPVITKLENLGYVIFTPDIGGIKKNLEELTNDLAIFIEKNKLNNFTIIGHSMGGVVGLNYYIQNKDKVNLLIALGSPFQKSKLIEKLSFFPILNDIDKFEKNIDGLNVYSIGSKADLVVPAECSYLEGAQNIVFNKIGHVGVVFASQTFSEIKNILSNA